MKRIILLLSVILTLSCSNKKVIDATGTFESTEIIVSSEVAGKIIELNICEGDTVAANIVLGYADTTQLFLQKLRLLASNNSLQSRKQDIPKQIGVIKQQIDNLLIEKVRFEKLVELKAGNAKQLDDIKAQIAFLNKQLTAQQSTLENSNKSILKESDAVTIQIAQIEDQLQRSYFKSPINGTLLSKYCEVGEIVYQGKPLFKVADLENMFLRAYIGNGLLSEIKIGQRVKVLIDSSDGKYKEYEGVISWISAKAEFTPKTIQTKDERENLVYAVKISVKNDGFIRIGMYADVRLK